MPIYASFDLGIVSVPSVGVFSDGELISVTKGPKRANEILAEVDRIAAGRLSGGALSACRREARECRAP